MDGGSAQPHTFAEEVGASDAGVGEVGSVYLYVGDVLCCGGAGGSYICIGDVGYVPMYWEDTGWIPPQGGPHTDGSSTKEGEVWDVAVPSSSRVNGGGGTGGGGDLRRLSPEHSFTVY